MRTDLAQLIVNGDMSGNITQSVTQPMIGIALSAIQAVWTGSPVGTLKLQISNDNVTYTDYTGSSTAVSGAGNFIWNLLDVGYRYIRVAYTAASGSGTLNANISIKGV